MQSEMEQRVSSAHNMDQYRGWQEFWPSLFSGSICSANLRRNKMLLDLRSKQALYSPSDDNLALFEDELSEQQGYDLSG
jgi:hypothetical protein